MHVKLSHYDYQRKKRFGSTALSDSRCSYEKTFSSLLSGELSNLLYEIEPYKTSMPSPSQILDLLESTFQFPSETYSMKTKSGFVSSILVLEAHWKDLNSVNNRMVVKTLIAAIIKRQANDIVYQELSILRFVEVKTNSHSSIRLIVGRACCFIRKVTMSVSDPHFTCTLCLDTPLLWNII